ncbi:tetratricopeptide repeat protein [Hyalangium gracile]|uniref:tetratricopeptide repeat protein n=1 Tax=Hyalangium gracile TaxID=394092 RepID=UPI001CCB3D87|nr:tetratricopeptide repeat protein [Hyalangium gracile]
MSDAPLQRWKDQPSPSEPVEAEARRLAREMPPAEALTPGATARIAEKLGSLPPPSGTRLPRGLPLLTVGALVVASALYFGLNGAVESPPSAQEEHPVEPAPEPVPAPPEPEEVPAPGAPSAAPPVTPEEAPAPPPPPAHREPRPENALLEEAKLLGRAVEQLRREQDPKAALVTLQRYFKRFPRGELIGEAEVTRVEALLREGRKSEALRHLERLHGTGFAGLPRPAELALQRAELLAEARRDPEAARAFSEVLDRAPSPALEERALFGRAVCRARAGDEAGMRADLDAYLRRFPEGRFAAEARERLESAAP